MLCMKKAHHIFWKAYDDLKKPTTKVGQTGDLQAIREKIQSVNHKFKSGLEKVLIAEQLA